MVERRANAEHVVTRWSWTDIGQVLKIIQRIEKKLRLTLLSHAIPGSPLPSVAYFSFSLNIF